MVSGGRGGVIRLPYALTEFSTSYDPRYLRRWCCYDCQEIGQECPERARPSNPGVPLVIDIILPIAAHAALDPGEAIDRLDPLDVLRLLVAELPLHPEA